MCGRDGRKPSSFRPAFAAGGSGGHMNPLLAAAAAAAARGAEPPMLFLATDGPLERRLLSAWRRAPLDVRWLPSPRPSHVGGVRALLRILRGARLAAAAMRDAATDVLVVSGCFASLPAALAALRLRIPLVLLEENAAAGRAARLISCWAVGVACPFERAFGDLPPFSGVPSSLVGFLRRLASLPPRPARLVHPLPIPASWDRDACAAAPREVISLLEGVRTPMLLVFGGSQGALRLVELVCSSAPRLLEHGWSVCLVSGPANRVRAMELLAPLLGPPEPDGGRAGGCCSGSPPTLWRVAGGACPGCVSPPASGDRLFILIDYCDWMPVLYEHATLALCRAGAMTVFELVEHGLPALLVPLPGSVRDHQRLNAEWLAGEGGALVVSQDELEARDLLSFLPERGELERMRASQNALRSSLFPGGGEAAASALVSWVQGLVTGLDG